MGFVDDFIDHFVAKYTKVFVTVSKVCADFIKNRSALKEINLHVIFNKLVCWSPDNFSAGFTILLKKGD